MAFSGTHHFKLDGKNRMRLPAKFRAQMPNGFFLSYGTNCITVYSMEMRDALAEKLQEVLLPDEEEEEAMEEFFGGLYEVEPNDQDDQGRFVLPAEYREFASIEKEIVFVGVNNHINLYSKEVYEAKHKSKNSAAARLKIRSMLQEVEKRKSIELEKSTKNDDGIRP